MERLQDETQFPDYLQPAGMPSIHGGLAAYEWRKSVSGNGGVGSYSWRKSVTGRNLDGLGQAEQVFQDPQVAADLVTVDPSLTTLYQDPNVAAAADTYIVDPASPIQAAIPAGASIDPTSFALTVDGFTYSPPGGAAPGIDPGWRQSGAGWYWQYANGDKSYLTGMYVWADGAYQTVDGYQILPGSNGYTIAPDGTVTYATAATPTPSAAQANGVSGSSILGFLKGLVGMFTGPSAPPGTQAGQVFRAANGQYYRLNANGTTTAVASPLSGGGGLGGLTSSPLLLVGLAVGAYVLLAKRRG